MATNKTYDLTRPLHDFPGGAANSAGMIESSTASCVGGWRSYTGNSAVTGTSYGGRFQHYVVGAAGSGAALRAYALVKGVAAAQLYGAEITAEVMSTTSSNVTNEVYAIKAKTDIKLSTSGIVGVIDLTMVIASAKTVNANSAFIKVQNEGDGTDCMNLFCLPNTTNGGMLFTDTTATGGFSIKFISADGTPYYIECHGTSRGT